MTNHHLCHSGKSSTCRYCDPPNRMPAARNHPQPRDACACSSERVAWEREHTVDTRAYMVPRTRTHETPISETTKVWKYSLWISTIQISSSATCRTGKLESKQRQKPRRCVGNHHGVGRWTSIHIPHISLNRCRLSLSWVRLGQAKAFCSRHCCWLRSDTGATVL